MVDINPNRRCPLKSLLLLLLLPGLALAGPRERLERFLADLHSLQARFEQTIVDNESDRIDRASGVLYLKRPGRFRWEYEGEYPRYLLADGHTVWLVETDLEQVSQRSQKKALAGTPAGLLAGDGDLDRDFRVEELGERQGVAWLRLVPRDPNARFEQILIGLDGDRITRLEMADSQGQVTNLRFFDIQKNIPLDDELFRFVPPPGYDILDQ